MPTDAERVQYLRWRTYLLASRNPFKPDTRVLRKRANGKHAEVIPAVPAATLAAEVARLPQESMLDRSADLAVYLAAAAQIPGVLREIGRLREITFRLAGEGTGRSIDLDEFDPQYLHLFVWNDAKQEIVGAYRLQATEATPTLYTQTLFQFDQRFLSAMGPAVELGRSFIRAEYQKGFAPLLLLWKGIGKFIAANPRYKILFGPVSISNQYQAVSRELMIGFLEARAGITDWVDLVRARNAPPRLRPAVPCANVEELSDVISDLEPSQAGIPVLLRQYLKLGGKLLGFNVDPEFSDVLDGLIVVDLTKTGPKLLERYLGKTEAASFLEFQKEISHGT
jgi:putative hemolysin